MKRATFCYIALSLFIVSCASAQDARTVPAYRDHPFFLFDRGDSLTADIALADMDGDGDLDALTANGRHWAQQDFIFLNAGNGRMMEAVRLGERLSASYKICPGDFDNDGDTDVVIVRDLLPAQVFLNDGHAGMTHLADLPGRGGAARSAVVLDANADGHLDVAIATRRGPDHLFLGKGDGFFSAGINLPGGGDGSTGIAAEDLDSDGDHDLVIARRDDAQSGVLINDGIGNFTMQPLPGAVGDHRKASIADFDGDGAFDIVLSSTDGVHKLYKQSDEGRYQAYTTFGASGVVPQAMVAADLDNDGDVDLVEGTETTNAIYLNAGNGQFERVDVPAEVADTYGIAVGDLNGDGVLDLVFANSENVNAVMLAR